MNKKTSKSKPARDGTRPLTAQELEAATGGGWIGGTQVLQGTFSGFQCDGLTSQVLITCSSLTYKP